MSQDPTTVKSKSGAPPQATVFGLWWGMRRLCVHFHLTPAVDVWLAQVMTKLSNSGTWAVVRKVALISITCMIYSSVSQANSCVTSKALIRAIYSTSSSTFLASSGELQGYITMFKFRAHSTYLCPIAPPMIRKSRCWISQRISTPHYLFDTNPFCSLLSCNFWFLFCVYSICCLVVLFHDHAFPHPDQVISVWDTL